uniref:restriction endonuclease subunit S n=1 Tax=Arthrobacter sp. TaxID=1667 RepID=UPI000EB64A78|nr:restriction endonuclease subunit S [Arthrobacter sp.]AXV46654.1 type I restriction-modification protein subunit S [Arthrobacter sp.]
MKLVRLGDHVEILSGFAFDSSQFATEGEMPLIRIRDVVRGRTETYFTGSFDERFVVRKGDLLVGMDGDFNRETWSSEPALLNQRVCRILSLDASLDPRYLYHFLPQALMEIWHATPFATVRHLSVKVIREISLPLPPIEEQRRIASILDKVDELRTKRRQALTQIDDLAPAIFHDMFGDPTSNPLGLPCKPLTEIGHLYSGGTPSKADPENWDGKLPWFSPKDMKRNDLFDSVDHISEDYPVRSSLKRLPKNTVAFVVRGMILAHTFPVSVIRVESTVNQDMKAVLPREPIDPDFLATCLRIQASRVLTLVDTAAHGTKKLDARALSNIPILVPELDAQAEFAKRIAAIRRLKDRHRIQLDELDTLFASLQDRAFNGNLR